MCLHFHIHRTFDAFLSCLWHCDRASITLFWSLNHYFTKQFLTNGHTNVNDIGIYIQGGCSTGIILPGMSNNKMNVVMETRWLPRYFVRCMTNYGFEFLQNVAINYCNFPLHFRFYYFFSLFVIGVYLLFYYLTIIILPLLLITLRIQWQAIKINPFLKLALCWWTLYSEIGTHARDLAANIVCYLVITCETLRANKE